MNAAKQGVVLIVGGLLILASLTTTSCSDKSRSTKSAPDRMAGSSGIFEKGKTYDIVTNVIPSSTVTVTEIGPQPWIKVKAEGDETEVWLNANHIIVATPATAKLPSKSPPASQPTEPVSIINTGAGEIPMHTYSIEVPPDGLKELGALCHRYMVKRGESWFMCRMAGGEKQVCEYGGVQASGGQHDLSQADKLNGYQWRGYCSCSCAAKRCYANGKWEDKWSDTTGMFSGSYMWGTDLNNKRGVWETKIEGFLPTTEWTIPQDSK